MIVQTPMTWQLWTVLIGAVALFLFSVTTRGGRLNTRQCALVGASLFAALIALLPPGKLGLLGSSYEPLIQAAAQDASKKTGAQVNALAQRVGALEAKMTALSSPRATPEQKKAAITADDVAKARYAAAAKTAEQSRRVLQSINPFKPCKPLFSEEGQPLITEDGKQLCG